MRKGVTKRSFRATKQDGVEVVWKFWYNSAARLYFLEGPDGYMRSLEAGLFQSIERIRDILSNHGMSADIFFKGSDAPAIDDGNHEIGAVWQRLHTQEESIKRAADEAADACYQVADQAGLSADRDAKNLFLLIVCQQLLAVADHTLKTALIQEALEL